MKLSIAAPPSNLPFDHINHDIGHFIEAFPSIGTSAIDFTLHSSPWVAEYLRDQWAPLGKEGFIDAHSALARLIVVSALLGSNNVRDLAYALELPTGFVRVSLVLLEAGGWRTSVLPALARATSDPSGFDDLKELVDNFLMSAFDPSVHWLDLMKVLGPEVIGLGHAVCGCQGHV